MMNDICVTDKTSIHVFEYDKLVGIYTKETGVPKILIEEEGLDKDWARARNREIENEIDFLREQSRFFTTHYPDIEWDHIEVIEENIKRLLEERDDITFKYGLAGKEFERLYLKKNDTSSDGADRDGDSIYQDEDGLITFSDGTQITRMGSEFDKSLMDTTLVQESNGDIRLVVNENSFRFITEEMYTLYSQKNTDYGDAFAQSLDEDGLLVSKIRIKDKLNRFSQLISNDALVNDESMRDTLIDLANYTVMTLMWLDENE